MAPATALVPPPAPPAMSRRQVNTVIAACITTLLLAVLDVNVVTTTATAIARDLDPRGGLGQVPWLVAVYVLVATVVQPLYGKLADVFGPRVTFLGTVGAFIAGSLLCAAATSMPELIAFRAVQGLGGGGLMSVTVVVLGHLRAENPSARGHGGNAFAGLMVGFGLVVGPLAGGALVAHASWRWIFGVNVPLAAAAWLAAATCLRLPRTATGTATGVVTGAATGVVAGTAAGVVAGTGAGAGTAAGTPGSIGRLDLPGAAALAGAAACLLLACQWGGQRYPWLSAPVLGLAVAAISLAAAFCYRQAHSPAPFFPPRLLRHRTLRVVSVLQLATGGGMAAATVYVTLDLQVIRHVSPSSTGVMLLPMAAGLAAGAAAGALILARARSVRPSVVAGTGLSALALGGLALTGTATPLAVLLALLAVLGIGVGLGMGNEIILVQGAVERRDLGTATTGVRFVETLGTSVAAAAFAALFAAGTGGGLLGSGHVMATIEVIFAVGAVLLALATLVGLRLPAGPGPS